MNNNYDNTYSLPFSEYIKNAKEYNKFAIAITKCQYAMEVNRLTHDEMVSDLIKKIRPDIKTDSWGNALNPDESFNNSNIVIVGYPNYVLVELPKNELLSNEQFDCLKNILYEVKKYNEGNKERGYGINYELNVYGVGNIAIEFADYQNNVSELIDKLKCYVTDDIVLPDEEIIGVSLSEKRFKNR